MIKVKLLFIGIFIWNLGSVYGQSCGTPMPTNVNAYSQPELEKTYNYGENICIDVQFHVVRNSDGSLAFTPESENAMLNELNEFFNPHQIFFNSVGTNFIDNTNYTIVSESEAEQLVTIDNNPNALNYYVVQELWNVGSGFVTGTAVSIPSNHLIIRNDRVLTSTAPHEAGHCLDLYHTFQGTAANSSGCAENIDGSNCFSCGDLICDTPADQGLGTINGFDPDLTNLMSYYHNFGFILDHFTDGQGWRMRQAILNNPLLQSLLNGSCSVSDIEWEYDAAVTCINQAKTFSLTNIPTGVSVNWSVTSNLIITSSSSDSVTVRLDGFDEDASITGTVIINGLTYIFTLELEQLTVPSASKITLESFGSGPIYTDRFTNITARYDWIIDVGQLGYIWEWVVPSSKVRYHHPTYSYIHVRPFGNPSSIYIKTRAKNECGCSSWKGKWFSVQTPPSGCVDCPTDGGVIHY